MGMLDDAIREHLELKRLKGADPGDVARQEHEALGRVRRDVDHSPEDDQLTVHDGQETKTEDDARAASSGTSGSVPHGAGQETIEINMEAELADAPAGSDEPPASRTAPVGHPAHTLSDSGDSLEWEMPGDRTQQDEPAEEVGSDEGDSDDGQVEDVLEETPDFLRETPEHERLWFEQRPPRDFDFNE
jgi:hypothetical protein